MTIELSIENYDYFIHSRTRIHNDTDKGAKGASAWDQDHQESI